MISPDVIVQICTRLAIRAFHFFAAPDTARTAGLVQLYTLSCNVLDMIHEFDLVNEFILYSTHWLYMMVLMAAMSILRITRSELRTHVDPAHGENAYFKAIKFCKKRSAENNDLDSRGTIILSQLWANDGMFRKNDGTMVGDRLRLRSRLVSLTEIFVHHHIRSTGGSTYMTDSSWLLLTSLRALSSIHCGTGEQLSVTGKRTHTRLTTMKQRYNPQQTSRRPLAYHGHPPHSSQTFHPVVFNQTFQQLLRRAISQRSSPRCSTSIPLTCFQTGNGPPSCLWTILSI